MISRFFNWVDNMLLSRAALGSSTELEEIILNTSLSSERVKEQLERWQHDTGIFFSDEVYIKRPPSSKKRSTTKGQSTMCMSSNLSESLMYNEHLTSAGHINKVRRPCGYFFQGSDMNLTGNTPLTLACNYGNLSVARYLIDDIFVDFEEKDKTWGYSPLHHACKKTRCDLVMYLVESGVDVNSQSVDQHSTALHLLAASGNVFLIAFLISKGANVNAIDKYGATPLAWAAYHGKAEAVFALLERGADKSIRNNKNVSAFDLARLNRLTTRAVERALAVDKSERQAEFHDELAGCSGWYDTQQDVLEMEEELCRSYVLTPSRSAIDFATTMH